MVIFQTEDICPKPYADIYGMPKSTYNVWRIAHSLLRLEFKIWCESQKEITEDEQILKNFLFFNPTNIS